MFLFVIAAWIFAIASAQSGLCPAPNGDFANPSSEQCTTFFRCIQGNPALLRCPANQRFDFLFRICRQQSTVNCNNQLQVFTAPAASAGFGGLGGGVGGLGALAGGQLGAGLPGGGIINLLSQLGGANGDGQSGNDNLATFLVMSALMSRMNSGTAQQGPPLPPFAGPVVGYPPNPANPLTLPLGPINSQNWQQPPSTGAGRDTGITLLLPQYNQAQNPQGQRSSIYLSTSSGSGVNQYTNLGTLEGLGPIQLQNLEHQSNDGQSKTLNATDPSTATKPL